MPTHNDNRADTAATVTSGRSSTTGLSRAALAAAAAGLFVFPVHPRSKVPAIEKWESAATRDLDQIHDIWSRQPYNVGLAVGRSRLVVIDLDERPGDNPPPEWAGATGGRDVLARLACEAGEPY